MKIGYYQYHPEFGAPKRNLEKVEDSLAGVDADIIVLPELLFTGQSQIVGPKGDVIASSNSDEEAVVLSDIDLSDARNKLIAENNNLFADRRPEFYASIV